MKKLFKNLLMMLLLAATMAVSSNGFALQQTDIATAQRQYDEVTKERRRLLERLGGLEDQYQGLVRKIEKLKSEGAIGTIGGRIELQNLLTQSKAIADELDGLQSRVRAIDNRLAGHRSTLVGGIDERLGELERSLSSAAPAKRGRIVTELNSLRKRRAAYTTPLPAAPSARDVDSALRLAEDAAHPDELMAAADELQDTEDQLRKRLSAIESKLGELREARALARRARSFSREEKFFEETDRDRVIARYEKVTVTQTGGESGSDNRDATAGNPSPPNDGAGQTANDDEAFAGGNNAFAETDGMAAPASDADDANTVDPGQRAGEPSISDSPTGATVASGSGDIFETSRETVVIDGGMDPSRAVGSLGSSNSNLDGQIRQLEGERSKLKKQANSLRKRARELRKQADEM